MRKRHYLIIVLLGFLLLPLQSVSAASVIFLYDGNNTHHQQYVQESDRLIRQALPSVNVVHRTLSETLNEDEPGGGRSLLITVGSAAAKNAADFNQPTLNTLITRRTFGALAKEYRSPRSSVFIEQSIQRQLELIKTALPSRKKLSVLVGSDSQEEHLELERESLRLGLEIEFVKVEGNGDIERIFSQHLLSDDTLLLLPDPQVVNRHTVKPLVLGSYRKGVPLVGYSQALVKAGALMAVHSPISALERQMMVAVEHFFSTGVLPAPQYAGDFDVSVNYQLARALKIPLPSERSLKKTLEEQLQ